MESMALCRAVGDRQGIGQTQLVLGNLARGQRDTARAITHYHESLLLRAQLEQCEDYAQTLEALAVCFGQIGQDDRAVQLVSGACQIRAKIRAPLTAFEQGMLDEAVAVWRARLGAAAFVALWRSGQELTFEQLTQRALTGITSAEASAQRSSTLETAAEGAHQHLLTAREREILDLMAAGSTNPQIAARLVIGAGTVKTHTLHIYRKLEVANRTQAILRAQEFGLLRDYSHKSTSESAI
jgi:non-specific serine/threonine protein kinase